MSIQNFKTSDPFALVEGAGSSTNAGSLIHIRLQQRNGRKTLTTVQGLVVKDYKKLMKLWKKNFSCNGTLVPCTKQGGDKGDPKEPDEIIFQLQGNHCDNIRKFLLAEGLASKDQVKVHGWNPEN